MQGIFLSLQEGARSAPDKCPAPVWGLDEVTAPAPTCPAPAVLLLSVLWGQGLELAMTTRAVMCATHSAEPGAGTGSSMQTGGTLLCPCLQV